MRSLVGAIFGSALVVTSCAGAEPEHPPGGSPDVCAPERFVQLGWGAAILAMDETDIFWAENSGELMTKPKRGGEARQLAWIRGHESAGSSVCCTRMAVGAESVYWTDSGRLRSVPKRGGEQVELASAGCWDLALDSTTVWCAGETSVTRVPAHGGPAEVVVEGQSHIPGIAVDATFVYWSVTPGSEPTVPCGATKRNPNRRQCTPEMYPKVPCDVLRMAKAGGPPEIIVPGRCGALREIGGELFLANGGAPLVIAGEPPWFSLPIEQAAGDRTEVYAYRDDKIMRVAKAGGAPALFVQRRWWGLEHLTLDRDHLYWIERGPLGAHGESSVMRASRTCRQ